jgi:hypothetical protein
MAWFQKKIDPLTDRARALNTEIAQLEAQIRRLDSQIQQAPRNAENPRLRSTAIPHGATLNHGIELDSPPPPPISEPIFEDIGRDRLNTQQESLGTPEHFNELGVRKYDLPGLLRRLRGMFQGPSATNPKLVNYLAAGGIQGLRPMRYEKRVARNRFLLLVSIISLVLLGIILALANHH